MIDLSFTGGFVTIKADAIGATTISEFADEGSPVEVDEIEVTGHQLMLNGSVLYWTKPTAYTAKVTVIPLSANDISLSKLLESTKVERTENGMVRICSSAATKTTMEIAAPGINRSGPSGKNVMRTWTFSNGRIVSGNPGIVSDEEGKMKAKTYSFVFERMVHNIGNGRTLNAGQFSLGK